MSSDPGSRAGRGLRPSIAEACRRQLAERLEAGLEAGLEDGLEAGSEEARSEHVAACAYCRDRLRAAAVLADACRSRPAAAAVSSDQLLADIYDRATEAAEQGPVGQWLREGLAVDAGQEKAEQADGASSSAPAASDALQAQLEGALSGIVRGDAEAMRRLMPVAHEPDAAAWSEVRRSILDEVAADRAASGGAAHVLRVPGWRTLLIGAAASAAIGLTLTMTGGSSDEPAQAPRIVFVDLEHPPTNEYTLARNGDVR